MRATLTANMLIACVLLTLSLWSERSSGPMYPLASEPAAATTAMADEIPGEDALLENRLSFLPPKMLAHIVCQPSTDSRLAAPAIFRPPIA